MICRWRGVKPIGEDVVASAGGAFGMTVALGGRWYAYDARPLMRCFGAALDKVRTVIIAVEAKAQQLRS